MLIFKLAAYPLPTDGRLPRHRTKSHFSLPCILAWNYPAVFKFWSPVLVRRLGSSFFFTHTAQFTPKGRFKPWLAPCPIRKWQVPPHLPAHAPMLQLASVSQPSTHLSGARHHFCLRQIEIRIVEWLVPFSTSLLRKIGTDFPPAFKTSEDPTSFF